MVLSEQEERRGLTTGSGLSNPKFPPPLPPLAEVVLGTAVTIMGFKIELATAVGGLLKLLGGGVGTLLATKGVVLGAVPTLALISLSSSLFEV